ncbi:unnamed protein product [Caenorhabditis brenneri]
MSNNLVEIRTSDGIDLVIDENTLSERTRRLVNMARKRLKKEPGAAAEPGFEVVQHPVTREEQKAEALMIQKELEEIMKAQDFELFMIIGFGLLIGAILAIIF